MTIRVPLYRRSLSPSSALERAIAPACDSFAGRMRARFIVGVLSVLVFIAVAVSASADPYRDQAETILCPSAPPGWFNPPESAGGRFVLTPLTAVAQTDDPTVLFGAPLVQLNCIYQTTGGK